MIIVIDVIRKSYVSRRVKIICYIIYYMFARSNRSKGNGGGGQLVERTRFLPPPTIYDICDYILHFRRFIDHYIITYIY